MDPRLNAINDDTVIPIQYRLTERGARNPGYIESAAERHRQACAAP